MKRCIFRCAATTLAVALCWGATDRPAAAQSGVVQNGPASLVGDWRGLYQPRSTDQGVIANVTMQITGQTQRRFTGVLALDESVHSIAGTISASGECNIVGDGDDGTLVANFQLHDFGGGAALVDGALKWRLADGAREEGQVVQIRSFPFEPENPPPDISGQWVGTYVSAVAGKKFAGTYRSVMTLPQGSSDFTGYAILDENTPSELTFPLVGTINGEGVFVRVGQNERAKLCVTGRLIPPADDAAAARIEATYVLKFFSGGFEDSGTLEQEVTPIPVVPDEPPEDDPIP